jgi:NAD-dependent dihydropyrimidine dehydrogenase PreA subunit
MAETIIPIINIDRCDRCGYCVSACPEDALQMTDEGPKFRQPITCTYCTVCEAICPQAAIRAPLTVKWGLVSDMTKP